MASGAAGTEGAEEPRARLVGGAARDFAEAITDEGALAVRIARRLAEAARGACTVHLVPEGGQKAEEVARHGAAPAAQAGAAATLPLRARGHALGHVEIAPAADVNPGLLRELVDLAAFAVANTRLLSRLERELADNRRTVEMPSITDFRRAAAEATRARLFLDAIVENIPAMIFVKDAEKLAFVRFNRAGEELLGIPRAELMGKSDQDFFPPDEAAFFQQVDRETLAAKELVDIPEEPIQTRHGQRWLHTRKVPILDDEGVPRYLLGISEDITDRKRADQLLVDAHAFAASIIATVRQPLMVVDAELHVVSVNPAFKALFLVSDVEVGGRPLREIGNRQWDIPRLDALLRGILPERGEFVEFEVEADFSRIGPRSILVSGRVMVGASETPTILMTFDDVTERRRAAHALEESNRELEAFSYSVSHDLRAPLRAIDGFSKILVEDHAGSLDPEAMRLLGVIRRNTVTMGQLIDALLVFSRLGRLAMHRRTVDMASLARAVADELTAAHPGRTVKIAIGELPAASCDQALMRQVWVNLLDNAIKYSGSKSISIVEVEGRVDGAEAVYTVRDNGIGFDMRYADKLFGVFQRLHAASDFDGTGVGLALVQRIVQRHGGRVWAQSETGKGALFGVALPVIGDHGHPEDG